jgi:predicted nucleic acid-binding protein
VTETVVVNASIAVKWLLQERYSREADKMLAYWENRHTRVTGPHLLPVEVSNALYKRSILGDISLATTVRLEAEFLESAIEWVQSASLHLRVISLAAQLQQNAVYNAHYLALAESLDCDLWTADQRFYQAAASDFPKVRWIGEM